MRTREASMGMTRRGFLESAIGIGATMVVTKLSGATSLVEAPQRRPSRVALIRTQQRAEGVRRAIALFGLGALGGKSVLIKPNYNSADPAPGSTHPEVLASLVAAVRERGAARVTVGDRSGMGDTREVLRELGVEAMARRLDFDLLAFDELSAAGWHKLAPRDSHWPRGIAVARVALESDALVMACALKTHRFGGHFTLSLKNGVGLVAKRVPGEDYDYMRELHASPHQRLMIAELNAAFHPALVVLDGVEAFVSGGPDRGRRVAANVVLASDDRVALDAVGVAVLRHFGTTPEVGRGRVFEQEQLPRAAELGLGARRAEDIELVTEDDAGLHFAERLQQILRA
jgi:uncharacterized protein (DUF362 family)